MRTAINWNAVNNDLSRRVVDRGLVGNLLDALGCEVEPTHRGTGYRGRCPFHGGANATSFEVLTDGTTLPVRWRCYSNKCHERPRLVGTLLGLVRGLLSPDPRKPVRMTDAVRYVERFLGEAPTAHARRAAAPPREVARPPRPRSRTEVRAGRTSPPGYFMQRGCSASVLDRLDVSDDRVRLRAVVPVYDDRGEWCVGTVARSMLPYCASCGKCHLAEAPCGSGVPKWVVEGGFRRGDYLYNLATARQTPGPFVLLLEGPADVFRAVEVGLPAVASLGADVTDTQLDKLAALGRKVVVGFDNDDAGRAQAPLVADRLLARGIEAEVRHPPDPYKDLGEMPVEAVRAWLADLVALLDEYADCPF